MRLSISKALVVFAIVMVAISCSSTKSANKDRKDVSPFDYGLATARTGLERYEVLLKTHRAAVAAGVNVDYSGIDSIDIEIPQSFKRIPLTRYNDFKGCVLNIRNTSSKGWLFYLARQETAVKVDKRLIDSGDFRSNSELSSGRCLLLVEDENPWVLNRKGHDYGHQRKDILLVENGRAKNKPVMPYNNDYSSPKCTYIPIGKDDSFVVKNLTVCRDPSCTFVTFLFHISGFDNVQFSNVSVFTPENDLMGDCAIRVNNSTNVTFTDVHIEGTYSQEKVSGYGISLGNVWNFRATNLNGIGNWGVFGTNNVNTAFIEDSQINRFDIHCYGRDISFKNVIFFDLYNQYSSVYGTIKCDKCTFTDFTPVLNGGSYNAYVEHEVVLNDCVFNATPKKNYLMRVGNMKEAMNPRHELADKCLPNVRIKNLVVNMMEGTEDFYVFYGKKAGEGVLNVGLSNITIDGLTINSDREKTVKRMMLSNIEIGTRTPVDCQIKNVKVNNPKTKSLHGSSRQSMQIKANLPLKGGKVRLENATGIKE